MISLLNSIKCLIYTSETLEGKWEYSDEEIMKVKMIVRWGPQYDLEQLLEHAVVHILTTQKTNRKVCCLRKNFNIKFLADYFVSMLKEKNIIRRWNICNRDGIS